jgi:hypothetical protein
MRGVAGRRLTLRLGPARNRLTEVLRMEQIATTLAVQSLARGGLLLHGGLAVRDGVGFILAGASGAGKSTACRRLPSPWRSLSDDCVLVVRDATGLYRAHPWPTWSLLRDNGRVESWPVGQAVPLKALLFLRQSPFDRAEPVAPTPATALIIESAVHLARTVALTPEGDANRAICGKYLRAARALAATVPAYRLHISLTGQFWNEIERVSAERCQRSAVRLGRAQNSGWSVSTPDAGPSSSWSWAGESSGVSMTYCVSGTSGVLSAGSWTSRRSGRPSPWTCRTWTGRRTEDGRLRTED